MSTVSQVQVQFPAVITPKSKNPPAYGPHQLITITAPESTVSEAYRILKTNLIFKNVEKGLKFIAVTSSLPSEGKSTTAANLAITLAHSNKRVILVDADLRRPSLHKIFGLSGAGLTNVLVGGGDCLETCSNFENFSLKILTSGPLPPNSSELLASSKMKFVLQELSGFADFVILDCPPVLGFNDALALAPLIDGYLLVVGSGKVPRNAFMQTKEQLAKVGAKIIGAIVNNLDLRDTQGSYYYDSDYSR